MIKVAINGFGRIGRSTFKNLIKNNNIDVVAINDLTDNETLAHLLKYDSVYRIYEKGIEGNQEGIKVDGKQYKVLSEKDPSQLPWKDLRIDVVLECTGLFTRYEDAKQHIDAGAKKVIISAPCKGSGANTYVLGANEEKYNPDKEDVISMGSCTTNCAVPVAKVINDNFEIEKGLMTTIHSYTSSQNIVDGPHKDLRRARAAAVNLVPTTTGAAISTIKVLPELKGKLDGIAVRVPSLDGSLLDFVICVKKDTSKEEVNQVFKDVSQKKLKGILHVEEKPLVSIDFYGKPHSAIVDKEFTQVQNNNLIKVLAWYDNEWGYAVRLAEIAEFVGSKL